MKATMLYRSFSWMCAMAYVTMGVPVLAAASPQTRAEEPQKLDYDALMAQAESKRRADAHAEAAELLGQAYGARPESERSDDIGEVVIRAAMAEYDLALAEEPTGLEQVNAQLELLEQERKLLDAFTAARTPERSPSAVLEARKLVERRRETLESKQKELEGERTGEVEVPAAPEGGTSGGTAISVVPPEINDEPRSPRRGRRMIVVGATLMGAGVAGLAMMASGLVAASNANHFDPSMSLAEREAQLARGELGNRLAVAGAVMGGVLEVAGVSLLSVGLARRRGASLTAVPSAGREWVGVMWQGRF